MDELEISGRRYISSRRAGKENKYHADYIGQLIRAKKVEGQKVGRAWYVDAESLAEYLGKPARLDDSSHSGGEAAPRAPLAPVARVVEKEVPLVVAQVEVDEPFVEEEKIEEPAPSLIYRTTKEAREARLPEQMRSGLRYISDEGPLIPQVQKQEQKNFIPIRHVVTQSASAKMIEDIVEPATEESVYEEENFRVSPTPAAPRASRDEVMPAARYPLAKKRKGAPVIVRAAVVLALGAVVFSVAAFVSTHLLFTVTVDGGQSANAGYSVK